MSIFAAVREQHPDWSDDAIYKEANLIYAEKMGGAIQVIDPSKPPEKSVVITEAEQTADDEAVDAEKGLQAAKDADDEQQDGAK